MFSTTLSSNFQELLARVADAVYPVLSDLRVTVWRTEEPVPFLARESGERREISVGEPWAERLFDCGWFRFAASIPEGETLPLVLRIDVNGELCLVDGGGKPVRGLTCVHSVFDRSLGTPAKTVYRLPRDLCRPGRLELWGDAGFNDLFGSAQGEGRIAFAQLCRCREDIRSLYYDLEVLGDLQRTLPADDPFATELLGLFDRLAFSLNDLSPARVEEAREASAPFLRRRESGQAPGPLAISAIGHSHLDLAWLWPIRETKRKGARTFSTVLYNQERYPEYVFGASQPQLFAWMKQDYPSLYGELRQAILAGRIELLGTMWVEPDCNIPSGESLVRQIVYGSRFFREEFGVVPRICWLPDVFGYNAQLPQILRKSGHDYFMTQKLSWNLVNRFPHHSFRWEGIDGSSILSHMLPEETYNGPAAPRSLEKIARTYAQKDVSGHALMCFGIGDGGGGPDAEHLERLRRLSDHPQLPSVRIEPAAKFFARWAEDAPRFPVWKGELYLERHQGTFTTQAATKKANRRCESALYELEWVSVLAERLSGTPYPGDRLADIWREVLLYQFHDILPGSSIKRVYDECGPRQAALLDEIEALAATRFAALAARCAVSPAPLVFNPLCWPRREWIEYGKRWVRLEIPALGWSPLSEASVAPLPTLSAESTLLENEHLRASFGSNGELVSLLDKDNSRETFPSGEPGNVFALFEDTGDAWDFPQDSLLRPAKSPTLLSSTAEIEGPCARLRQEYSLGASSLSLEIELRSGERTLSFAAKVRWSEPRAMLRVRFPVAVESAFARFEIPFGSLERSTSDADSWKKAQFEVPAQQWVDLSSDAYGVSLFNDCKYGFRVKGHTIDMNLIRSVPHPGRALINKDDLSGESASAAYTDFGNHEFRYALWPHPGRTGEGELTRLARCFNVSPRIVVPSVGAAKRGAGFSSFVEFENPGVEVTALKQAEDGRGWILRLCRLEPKPATLSLKFALPFEHAAETDLLENTEKTFDWAGGARLDIAFAPFEIKTLRLW